MVNKQILQSIEGAIAHKCPKDEHQAIKCAHCEIGYSFIACKPVVLDCGHQVCKECDKSIENGCNFLTCKFCAKKIKTTGGQCIAADSLFQAFSNHLAKELKEKYKKAINLYEGDFAKTVFKNSISIFNFNSDRKSSSQIETQVEKIKQKLKNEIDLKVELVKEEIEKLRSELHGDVDRLCDDALKYETSNVNHCLIVYLFIYF